MDGFQMPKSREEAAAMLLSSGAAKPEELAAVGLGHVARQYSTGFAGPAYEGGPDKVATRAAWTDEKKRINADRARVSGNTSILSQLDQFEEMNKQVPTGPSAPLLNTAANWIGRGDPRVGTMGGIKSRLQGQARPPGSGATSDFEQRLYAQGVPGPDKPGNENENIIHHMRGTFAEENDRLAAQETWLDRRGTLNGFQQAWGGYLKDMPYTTTNEHGEVRGVGNRQPWDEYFGLKPSARGALKVVPRGQEQPKPAAADVMRGRSAAARGMAGQSPAGAWKIERVGP